MKGTTEDKVMFFKYETKPNENKVKGVLFEADKEIMLHANDVLQNLFSLVFDMVLKGLIDQSKADKMYEEIKLKIENVYQTTIIEMECDNREEAVTSLKEYYLKHYENV